VAHDLRIAPDETSPGILALHRVRYEFALPLCAVSLMSTHAWGWLPGAFGIVGTVGAGAWILSRIRSK